MRVPTILLGAALLCANHAPVTTPAQQFEQIRQLVGKWHVAETDRLSISFVPTAADSVIVERWETSAGLHSLTVYHMDGDELVATHYCPQGNQPRLVSDGAEDEGAIRFAFRDATDLDPGESFQHDLALAFNADGSVTRSEAYRGPEGQGEPSSYTLRRAAPD